MVSRPSTSLTRRAALGTLGVGNLALAGRSVQAQAAKPGELKVGITTYLSGPASALGVPGRQAADILFDDINAEGGIAGVRVRPIFVDEGTGVDHFVGEYRRLVQSKNVNIIFLAFSSADCLAYTPLADELKRPTFLLVSGTQRIFEDARYQYAVRTQGNATPEAGRPFLRDAGEARNQVDRGGEPGLRLGTRFLGDLEDRNGDAEAGSPGRGRILPALWRDRFLGRGDPSPRAPAGRDPLDLLGRRSRRLHPAGG